MEEEPPWVPPLKEIPKADIRLETIAKVPRQREVLQLVPQQREATKGCINSVAQIGDLRDHLR